jgi:cell division protein FtsB
MGAMNRSIQIEADPFIHSGGGMTAAIPTARAKKAATKRKNDHKLRRKFGRKTRVISRFAVIVIFFVLGLLLVGEYSMVQNMGIQLNEQKTQLEEIYTQNEQLRRQAASLANKSDIKEKAQTELGMQEAQKTIVYTPQTKASESDSAEAAAANE